MSFFCDVLIFIICLGYNCVVHTQNAQVFKDCACIQAMPALINLHIHEAISPNHRVNIRIYIRPFPFFRMGLLRRKALKRFKKCIAHLRKRVFTLYSLDNLTKEYLNKNTDQDQPVHYLVSIYTVGNWKVYFERNTKHALFNISDRFSK